MAAASRAARGFSDRRPDWDQFAGEGWEERIMAEPVTDRLHEKQGRSIGRRIFVEGRRELSVYLKRHYRLPWWHGAAGDAVPRTRVVAGVAGMAAPGLGGGRGFPGAAAGRGGPVRRPVGPVAGIPRGRRTARDAAAARGGPARRGTA